jgi:solute carrier family 25 protein 34/35
VCERNSQRFFLSILGIYQTIDDRQWNRNSNGELVPVLSILWGGVSGVCGSSVACPLYMIKTQIQAQCTGKYQVGYQHHHESTLNAIMRVINKGGIKGKKLKSCFPPFFIDSL